MENIKKYCKPIDTPAKLVYGNATQQRKGGKGKAIKAERNWQRKKKKIMKYYATLAWRGSPGAF